jgi:hypothetical protein
MTKNKMGNLPCLVFCFLVISGQAFCQSIPISNNDRIQVLVDRLAMKLEDHNEYHSSHRYITRADLSMLLHQLDMLNQTSLRDKADIQYLIDENMEGETYAFLKDDSTSYRNYRPHWNRKPILNVFYKTPSNCIQVDKSNFYLRLNPVFDFNYGKAYGDSISTTFRNVRGIEMRGGIADKVWFYSSLHETQEAFPAYTNRWIAQTGAVPGAGYIKVYEPSFAKNVRGYDYLSSQGIIGFNIIPEISVQLGHGRNFIGNGYRSLFLSDVGANYFYLKLNTRVWIFDYENIFAELNAQGQRVGDRLIPKKYFATHHLSLNLTDRINIGLFESIVFSRPNHFELQYLNPVIFYRTVEQMVGSPDNAMIGADMSIKLGRSIKLYGQLLLDELIIKNLLKQNGWWGNKYGIQAGLQYFDVAGIDHLDMRVEFNLVRPYTYSDSDSTANYSHHLQPLAHPMGANFYETILQMRYAPIEALEFNPFMMYAVAGEDYNGINSGSNILKLNKDRTSEFDVDLPNGYRADIWLVGMDMSYSIYHNLYADASVYWRKKKSVLKEHNRQELTASVGLRMNIGRRKLLF